MKKLSGMFAAASAMAGLLGSSALIADAQTAGNFPKQKEYRITGKNTNILV